MMDRLYSIDWVIVHASGQTGKASSDQGDSARPGNMRRLSEKTGVCYSIINSFNSGKSNICNIPLGTLMRIFPDLSIRFFKEDGSGGDSRAKDSDC